MIKQLLLILLFVSGNINTIDLTYTSGSMPWVTVLGISSEQDLEQARTIDFMQAKSKSTLRYTRDTILNPAIIIAGLLQIGAYTFKSPIPYLQESLHVLVGLQAIAFFMEKTSDYPPYRVMQHVFKGSFFIAHVSKGTTTSVECKSDDISHLAIYGNDGHHIASMPTHGNNACTFTIDETLHA